MSKKDRIAYFGYGSLVNRETLRTRHQTLIPARLRGWRRHWQCREDHPDMSISGDIALLSIHRHPQSTLSGMLIIDEKASLPHLDLREAHYDRIPLLPSNLEFADDETAADLPEMLFVYVGRPVPPREKTQLLQSYLDAVMAGYLQEFGEQGVVDFLQTTVGFDRPIVCDRQQPRYARAIALDPKWAAHFDDLLASAGVDYSSAEVPDAG